MIRTDRWKLIFYPHLGRYQLFDLEADPHEVNDLSADASQADRVKRLRKQMEQWFRRQGDTVWLNADR